MKSIDKSFGKIKIDRVIERKRERERERERDRERENISLVLPT